MVSVAKQDAKGTLIDGKRIMDSILQAHPDVKGVICGNGPVALGALAMVAAVGQMTLQRTTVIPRRNPSSLVTGGLFAWSRNPIYLGDALILTGAILWLDAVLALPLVASFVWVIRTRFIRDEEARLTLAFGPEFDLWAARTRRWFGRK